MRRLVVLAVLGLHSACSLLPTDSDTRAVRMEQEFTLSEGRSALVLGPRIRVEFLRVTEDLRCPIEARCISGGHAVVQLRLSMDGAATEVVELRTDEPFGFAVYDSYSVQLHGLDPPRSVAVADPDYRALLVVGGPSLPGGD